MFAVVCPVEMKVSTMQMRTAAVATLFCRVETKTRVRTRRMNTAIKKAAQVARNSGYMALAGPGVLPHTLVSLAAISGAKVSNKTRANNTSDVIPRQRKASWRQEDRVRGM